MKTEEEQKMSDAPETDALWVRIWGGTAQLEDAQDLSSKLEGERDEAMEALDCLLSVIGLTPIAGNKQALQEAFDLGLAVLQKKGGRGMSAPIYAVFSGVPGTAELRWHGTDLEEADRLVTDNIRTEPLISLRALPPDWQWNKTVFRWEDLPGVELPLKGLDAYEAECERVFSEREADGMFDTRAYTSRKKEGEE